MKEQDVKERLKQYTSEALEYDVSYQVLKVPVHQNFHKEKLTAQMHQC